MAPNGWSRPYNLVVRCLRGLEHHLFNELVSFGLERNALVKAKGRVTVLESSHTQMYFLSYFSRIATHLHLELGRLRLGDRDELFRGCESLPWSDFMGSSDSYLLSCSSLQRNASINSRRYACQLVKDGISNHFARNLGLEPPRLELKTPEVRLDLEVDADCTATLSVDALGAPLSNRAYRSNPKIGSIDPTVAASILFDIGYSSFSDPPYCIAEYERRCGRGSGGSEAEDSAGSSGCSSAPAPETGSIVDLFSGCGVFLIEAALLRARVPPGFLGRRYSYQRFPGFDRPAFEALGEYVEERRLRPGTPEWESLRGKFVGIERDWEKLEASLRSCQGAGVLDLVRLSHADYLKHGLADARDTVGPAPWRFMVAQLPKMKRLVQCHAQAPGSDLDAHSSPESFDKGAPKAPSRAPGKPSGKARRDVADELSAERYLALVRSLALVRRRHFEPGARGVLILPSFIHRTHVQESFGSRLSVGRSFVREGVGSTSYYAG